MLLSSNVRKTIMGWEHNMKSEMGLLNVTKWSQGGGAWVGNVVQVASVNSKLGAEIGQGCTNSLRWREGNKAHGYLAHCCSQILQTHGQSGDLGVLTTSSLDTVAEHTPRKPPCHCGDSRDLLPQALLVCEGVALLSHRCL